MGCIAGKFIALFVSARRIPMLPVHTAHNAVSSMVANSYTIAKDYVVNVLVYVTIFATHLRHASLL